MKSEVNTTIDTSKAPKWFPSETPDERVYWATGVWLNPNRVHDRRPRVCESERAAWVRREMLLATGHYTVIATSPVPMTKSEAIARARLEASLAVIVLDEHGNIVEEWTV